MTADHLVSTVFEPNAVLPGCYSSHFTVDGTITYFFPARGYNCTYRQQIVGDDAKLILTDTSGSLLSLFGTMTTAPKLSGPADCPVIPVEAILLAPLSGLNLAVTRTGDVRNFQGTYFQEYTDGGGVVFGHVATSVSGAADATQATGDITFMQEFPGYVQRLAGKFTTLSPICAP